MFIYSITSIGSLERRKNRIVTKTILYNWILGLVGEGGGVVMNCILVRKGGGGKYDEDAY